MSFPPDGGDLNDLLAQMLSLQTHLAEADASTAEQEVEGSAADGAVRVRVAGEFSFRSVSIDPAVVDPNDPQLLEDLVLAALRDASTKLLARRREAMGTAVSEVIGDLFGGLGGEAGPDSAPELPS